ncbi:urease accessory protein UreF [Allohahella marinimesophila]|uniref:Urease accessory protein UreF n=1 Tax=Allohahella marinimesophila TaxID=1054972 RepID=A0ABP7NM50_9GAMM
MTARFAMMYLASPALPVGGFAWSQGLESAIELGWVKDRQTLADWLSATLEDGIAQLDLPAIHLATAIMLTHEVSGDGEAGNETRSAHLHRLLRACSGELSTLSQRILAFRETSELLAEDRQLAATMARLLSQNPEGPQSGSLSDLSEPREARAGLASDIADFAWPLVFALGGRLWKMSAEECASAFVWSWLENQVSAAQKTIPLGQTDAQSVLQYFLPRLDALVTRSAAIGVDDIGSGLPGMAIASMLHETQYARLFRS